jgi:hypothetical protein
MDLSAMRKALVGAALPLVYAVVQQLTGMGDGPTPDMIAGAGDAIKLAAEMLIGGFLVWLIPNKPAEPAK